MLPMTVPLAPIEVPVLHVRPWPVPGADLDGHPVDGEYVETFWLGVLGPTATWLLRRLVTGLHEEPEGYELDLFDTARSLGLAYTPGRASPFTRAIDRCVRFGMAQRLDLGTLAVRRTVPGLTAGRVSRLPPFLQAAHRSWPTP